MSALINTQHKIQLIYYEDAIESSLRNSLATQHKKHSVANAFAEHIMDHIDEEQLPVKKEAPYVNAVKYSCYVFTEKELMSFIENIVSATINRECFELK